MWWAPRLRCQTSPSQQRCVLGGAWVGGLVGRGSAGLGVAGLSWAALRWLSWAYLGWAGLFVARQGLDWAGLAPAVVRLCCVCLEHTRAPAFFQLLRQPLLRPRSTHLPATFPPPSDQGRIFVLAAAGAKFNVVCEKETRGAVYALCEFQGRLLAGINSRVQMYR